MISEDALRHTTAKFVRRFSHIEHAAASSGRPVSTLSLTEMETLWEESKNLPQKDAPP